MKTHKFIFTQQAQKDLKKFSPKITKQIRKKLEYFSFANDPLEFAKPLISLPPATHRFRFGKLRITFYVQNSVYYICMIKFRKNVYE